MRPNPNPECSRYCRMARKPAKLIEYRRAPLDSRSRIMDAIDLEDDESNPCLQLLCAGA